MMSPITYQTAESVSPQQPSAGAWPWIALAVIVSIVIALYVLWRKVIRPEEENDPVFPARSVIGLLAGYLAGLFGRERYSKSYSKKRIDRAADTRLYAAADYWSGPIAVTGGTSERVEIPLGAGFGRSRRMVSALHQAGYDPVAGISLTPRGWLTANVRLYSQSSVR